MGTTDTCPPSAVVLDQQRPLWGRNLTWITAVAVVGRVGEDHTGQHIEGSLHRLDKY